MSDRAHSHGGPDSACDMECTDRPIQAQWDLTLYAECPACRESVDLLDEPDFWDGRTLEPCQRAFGIEVVCPKCSAEFAVDCVY